ncbi:MAG: prolipoprotein diacylglyceryl transferase [Anaerolineales bacterium]|nr:prolipoprotein diacylglyceryl transferase [Anaerolineales bacterium]
MLPILQLGPLAIQTPGLILLLGLWLGLTLAEKNAHRQNLHPDLIYNLAFTALLAGVIGARLAYAARYPAAFAASPISLISLNPGLLDPVGGVAVALLAAMIFGQRQGLAFWPALDAFTPLFFVLSFAFALSNLASGNAFGTETTLPWGIELWGAKRHPAQLYEALAALGIAILLWPGRGVWARRAEGQGVLTSGVLFIRFVALSAASRLFLEAFRGDSVLLPNGWRVAQILAWLVLATSLWGLERRNPPANKITRVTPQGRGGHLPSKPE